MDTECKIKVLETPGHTFAHLSLLVISHDIQEAVIAYAREQSDENRKKLEDELSTSKYKEIRNDMLLAIKEKMATLLSEYNTNMLHERNTIEPLDWLRENI